MVYLIAMKIRRLAAVGGRPHKVVIDGGKEVQVQLCRDARGDLYWGYAGVPRIECTAFHGSVKAFGDPDGMRWYAV